MEFMADKEVLGQGFSSSSSDFSCQHNSTVAPWLSILWRMHQKPRPLVHISAQINSSITLTSFFFIQILCDFFTSPSMMPVSISLSRYDICEKYKL
jgi:hypothetical protein